jgi:hypothetical protein
MIRRRRPPRIALLALAWAVGSASAQVPACAGDGAALLAQAQAWREQAGRLPCHEVANASVVAPPPGQEPRTSTRWEWNAALSSMAQEHALSLAQRQVLEHLDAQGRGLAARAGHRAEGFRLLAENLGRGAPALNDMLQTWTTSLAHCVHLANQRYTEAGLACAEGLDGRYWVMVFGRR